MTTAITRGSMSREPVLGGGLFSAHNTYIANELVSEAERQLAIALGSGCQLIPGASRQSVELA